MKMIRALLAAMISSALPYLLYGDYNASESLDQAKMYLETDEIQAGEAILLRIVSSDSPLPEASFLLGQLYFNKNNWEESLKHLSNAVASEDNFKAHLVLAKVWLAGFKNISMAQTHVDNANAISPNNERVHCTQALIFLYQGQDFRAQEYFEFAEEINPHIDRLSIAKVLLHFKHVNLAEKWLEKAHIEQCVPVKKSSVCVEILLLLAESREHRGDTYSPKRLYTEALKLEPRNPVAHTALALLLLGTGVYNYGAPEACGMNQEDAINHLAVAWQNSNPHKQKAISALQFCIKELHEVEIWHRHAAPLIVKTPLLRMFRFVGLNSSIVSIIMSPLIALIRLSEFFFQSMFGLTTPTFKPLVSAHLSSPSPADNMRRQWERRATGMNSSLARVELQKYVSFEGFKSKFVLSSTPAVITDLQTNWELTPQRLRAQFANSVVRVHMSPSGRFDGPESGSLWGLSADTEVLVRPPATSMRLKDFLRHVQQQKQTSETFYIEYLALHQYLGPSFERLVQLPSEIALEFPTRHLVTNVWIGGQPTNSPLHYDDYDNFLCQVEGQKEIILFPPADVAKLYYKGRIKGTLEYTYPGIFTRNFSTLDHRSFLFGSSVNIDRPNTVKHPLYLQATPLRVLLSPGESLYLPAFWHHEVQSLPSEESGLNIAVNFWFQNASSPVLFH